MQKYIKNDLSEIRYFEDDVKVKDWIDLKEYRLMTSKEVHKHENPYDYLTEIQKRDLYLKSLKPLTRRQFKLALVKSGLNLSEIESKINELDNQELLIEWEDATEFERLNPSLLLMCEVLELNESKVDELWEFGLTL
jgi:hypothetical protein